MIHRNHPCFINIILQVRLQLHKENKKYQVVEIQDDRIVLMEVGAADMDFEKRKIIDL